MKKIMIVLTAVALAMGVNAASVNWKLQEAYTGTALEGQQVMAFNGADYAAVIDLLTTTGSETMDTALAGYRLGDTKTIINNRTQAVISTVALSDAPDLMFWVLFQDKSTDAGSAISWTAATDVTGIQYTPPESGSAFTLTSANFTNSGTIANIPEPTSGLLLLVGMGALALRRLKRA